MAGIRIEFAQFGDFDSFDVIRSTSSMSSIPDDDLPSPIATGLTTMYYVDTTVVINATYYYRIRVWRNGVSIVSDEISVIANSLWTPHVLTLALWLDAKDTSTLTVALDNTVSEWRDKSGNNRHAVQNELSLQPFYSASKFCVFSSSYLKKMTGVFTGINDGGINEYTLFIVVKPKKTSAYVSGQNNSGASFYSYDAYNSIFFGTTSFSGSNTDGATSIVFSATTNAIALTETRNNLAPHLISRAHSIGSEKLMIGVLRTDLGAITSRINGDSTSGATALVNNLGWKDYSIFGQYTANSVGDGEIHEILLVHNGDLGDEVICKIEGFLAHKWDLLDNLPINHPYKTSPPFL